MKPALKRSRPAICAALAMLVMALASPATAAEIVPVKKQKFKVSELQDKPGLRVIATSPMTVKLGGIYGVMGYRWVLEEGTYKDLRTSVIDGREVAFVPVRETGGDGGGVAGGTGSLGACYTPAGNFILLDVNTGDVLERGIWRYEVAQSCGGGAKLEWRYKMSKISEPGNVRIVWGQDWIEMDQRAADRQSHTQGLETIAEARLDAGTREDKQKIGTRICRIESGIRYVGYTEAVSPDNGKIQIRVADAHFDGHPRSHPGGFQPSILWGNPDDWDLCE